MASIEHGWINGAYRVRVPVRVPPDLIRRLGDGHRWPQRSSTAAREIAERLGRALRLRVVEVT